ncbi:hypothetical protein ACSBR2_034801 [Camellia fascicularis]
MLEVVAITSDNEKFEVETEYKDWLPLFQLKVLVLPNCNLNKRSGDFLKFLLHQNRLSFIVLSHNNLEDNHLIGHIQLTMREMVPYLIHINLSRNAFEGSIPSSIGKMRILEFPCALVPNVFMDISYNSFSGSFPFCSNPNLGVVGHMHLQGNKFAGFIPKALLNSSKLVTLDVSDNNLSGSIPPSIRLLSNLSILLLKGNQLGGSMPTQLCQLNKISLMNLSINSFAGSIPLCLSNITFGGIGATDLAFTQTPLNFYSTMHMFYIYENVLYPHLEREFENGGLDGSYDKVDEVEFVTKSRTNSYWDGSILNFMSRLDLSCNKLRGELPFELGKLSSVRALNFVLTTIYQVKILDRKAQFWTFEASSCEGNPFLCGQPLERNCKAIVDLPYLPTTASSDQTKGKWYDIDRVALTASFVRTYITFLFGFAAVFYINPYWRQRWFDLIEEDYINQ